MPTEGAADSQWWWSSLDVRCDSCSLIVLFLHSKPGKMEFLFPKGTDLGVKLLNCFPKQTPADAMVIDFSLKKLSCAIVEIAIQS